MRKRTPRRPTAMEAAAMTAGPVRNLTAIAKAATEFPHAMILGCNAMNSPAVHHSHPINPIITLLKLKQKINEITPTHLSSSPPPPPLSVSFPAVNYCHSTVRLGGEK